LRDSQKVPRDLSTKRRWPIAVLITLATAALTVALVLRFAGGDEEAPAPTPTATTDAGVTQDAALAKADAAIAPAGMIACEVAGRELWIAREPVNRGAYLEVFPKDRPGGSGPEAAVSKVSRQRAKDYAAARAARLATQEELAAARAARRIAATGLYEWTADTEGKRPISVSPKGEGKSRRDRGYRDVTFRLVRDLPKKKK